MRKFFLLLIATLILAVAGACGDNVASNEPQKEPPVAGTEDTTAPDDVTPDDVTPDDVTPDEPNEDLPVEETAYVRIYYVLAADDATVDASFPYSEEKGAYYTEIEKGCAEYVLMKAYRADYVLIGWLKADGTKFVVGTPIQEDITLTASWADKNGGPLV